MRKYTIKTAFLFFLIFIILFVASSLIYSFVINESFDISLLSIKDFNPILGIFGFYAFVFLVVISISYSSLKRKNDDIELSKINYYYSKPYIVKINNKGICVSFNKVFESKIKDCKRYKNIYDIEYLNESYDRLEEIHKQHSFVAAFESNNGTREYVKFLPFKIKTGYYLLGENITSEQKNLDYHRNMALFNNITKLPNKNFLGIKLQELFEDKASLKKKNSLVAIDVIGFKNINKLFGHKIGDETLVEVSSIIKKSLEGYQSVVFNPELDTFMILINNVSKYKNVEDWVADLLVILDKPLDIQGNLFMIEVKVGIFHIDTDKYQNLNSVATFDNTILALKKAKGSRRLNTIVYDITIGQLFTREQAMETDLVHAVRNKELTVYLQPQFNTLTQRIVAFEALIRWNNPKYMYDSPSRFIELAEQNNMIVDIGRFVINETFKIAKELEVYDIKMSLNISPVQILQSGFVHDIIVASEKHKLKRNSICLEITETFLMETFDNIVDKLFLLKKQGFSIHLDNFGTGYSSMLYLKDLPIDAISIEKDFIKNLNNDKYTRVIVSKIISLAKSLELEVIAEGVEDESQNQFLMENGCNIIQGFLISKAVTKSEAINLLLKYNEKFEQFSNIEI